MAEQTTHPGDHVRQLLKARGQPITDAAVKIGVSRQQLTRLLGAQSAVSPEMALRLESAYGLPARALLEMQLDFDLGKARAAMSAARETTPSASGVADRPEKDEILRRLRLRRREFERSGIGRLFLFGSVARGEAGAFSDVDLYFEAAPDASIGLVELGALTARLEAVLGRRVDLVPADSFRPKVRARVVRDAVLVF